METLMQLLYITNKMSDGEIVMITIAILLGFGLFIAIVDKIFLPSSIKDDKDSFIFKDNKKLSIEDVPIYREIPCNKDIYYANVLAKLNGFEGYKDTNLLGAIILKWINDEKVKIIEKKDAFGKLTNVIELPKDQTFDNELETKLFNMMYEASNGGLLEKNEFAKWCKKNNIEFLIVFSNLIKEKFRQLYLEGRIQKIRYRYRQYVMDDTIYEDSKKLLGFKKFLLEFSKTNLKDTTDVHLLDEYLIFAYIFGIADKVVKQFDDLYPKFSEQINFNNDAMLFADGFSSETLYVEISIKNNF